MMRLFSVLMIAGCSLSQAGCHKPYTDIDNLNGNRIAVIGHGGSGFIDATVPYPANSEASILNAIATWNADGAEIDIQLSKDGVPFAFHDLALNEATWCNGLLRLQTADFLRECHYKPVPGTQPSNEYSLAELEHILKLLNRRKQKPLLFLELKVPKADPPGYSENEARTDARKLLGTVRNVLETYDAWSWTFMQCLDRPTCTDATALDNRLRVLYDGDITQELITEALNEGWYGLAAKSEDVSERDVEDAQNAGLRVQLYGAAGQKAVQEAINKHPDYLLAENVLQVLRMVPKQ